VRTLKTFQGTHILGASRGLLCDSYAVLLLLLSVCPPVRPSVNFFCGNHFYYAKNGSIATKLAQDGLQVGAHPGCAQGQGQGQRSRDTGICVLARKKLWLSAHWLAAADER